MNTKDVISKFDSLINRLEQSKESSASILKRTFHETGRSPLDSLYAQFYCLVGARLQMNFSEWGNTRLIPPRPLLSSSKEARYPIPPLTNCSTWAVPHSIRICATKDTASWLLTGAMSRSRTILMIRTPM